MSPRNRNLKRPPIIHKYDLTGLNEATPEKRAEIWNGVRKRCDEIFPTEQSNKKNSPADSYDWTDSGVGSASWLRETEVGIKKKATKPKCSRKARSLVLGKWPNKGKNNNVKNNTPKSRPNISSKTQNVDPHNVRELEDSVNGKRKYSEEEIANIRIKRRKWLETRETDSQWIKCCHQKCGKWRLAFEYEDAAEVPEIWYCSMNGDPDFASCDVPEEKIPKTVHLEMIESRYSIGSIVWARLDGFPWWPAIVDECPDLFKFCQLQGTATVPFKYHVVFIEGKDRAWVHERNLKAYKNNPRELVVKKTKFRNIDYKKDLDDACALANGATSLTVSQRIKKFGWAARSSQKNGNKKKPSRKSQRLAEKYVLKDNGLTREQEIERKKVETRFQVGDVVWAQPYRYPWWPAMIDTCPITNEHIHVPKTRRELSMYYVVYFNDQQIEYDWISEEKVEQFSIPINRANLKQDTKYSNGNHKQQLEESYKLAMEATRMSLARRLLKFGISQRLEQQLSAYGNEAAWLVREGSPPYYKDEEAEPDELMDQPISVSNPSVSRLSKCESFGSSSTCTRKSWESAASTTSGKSRRISQFFFPQPGASGSNDFFDRKKLRDASISSWDSNVSKYRLRSRSNSKFSSFSDDSTKLGGIPLDEIFATLNGDL